MKEESSAIGGNQEAVGLVLGLVGVLVFSFSLPATKLAVPVFGGWFVGIGRAVLAGGLAATVLIATKASRPSREIRNRLAIVAMGVVVGFPLLTALALEFVPASRGAIIVGVLPATTAAVAALRHGERPSARFWLAAAGGLITVVIFAWATGSQGRPEPADGLLLLAVVAAAVGYAEGSAVSKDLGGWQTISWALVYSLPVTIPVATVAFVARVPSELTGRAVVGLLYVSIFSMFLGFFAWYAGLNAGGVARVSQLQLLQPILTLGWAALFLGENITLGAVAAALGVLAFVVAARRAPIHRPPDEHPSTKERPTPITTSYPSSP